MGQIVTQRGSEGHKRRTRMPVGSSGCTSWIGGLVAHPWGWGEGRVQKIARADDTPAQRTPLKAPPFFILALGGGFNQDIRFPRTPLPPWLGVAEQAAH